MKSISIDNRTILYVNAHSFMLATTLWIEMAIESNISKLVLMMDHGKTLSENNILYFMLVTSFILLIINMVINMFFVTGYLMTNFYKEHYFRKAILYNPCIRYLESYTVVIWLLSVVIWLTINFSYFLNRIF